MKDPKVAYRGRVKYDESTARKYQVRKESKHRAEMKLVSRAFALIPKSHRVLDIPCGGGRVVLHLSALGYPVTGADLSEAMLAIARDAVAQQGLKCSVERQDLEQLTFPSGHFDTIICFRLFHHFPSPGIRSRAVAELCRVARRYVVLSYFSPWSPTSLKRALRKAMGGKASEKHATPLSEVEKYFEQAGFTLVRDFTQLPLIHTLHLAVFQRRDEVKP
jgi:ubiquinone/menaquinone biosynthesis C-methylase UbiE